MPNTYGARAVNVAGAEAGKSFTTTDSTVQNVFLVDTGGASNVVVEYTSVAKQASPSVVELRRKILQLVSVSPIQISVENPGVGVTDIGVTGPVGNVFTLTAVGPNSHTVDWYMHVRVLTGTGVKITT